MQLRLRAVGSLALALAFFVAPALVATDAEAAAATVREPAYGLPHIYADTDLELARENGREIAKDRLAQIILLARAGRGTLFQAFGSLDPGLLNSDIEARLTGYTSSELNGMWSALPEDMRDLVMEYCKGVNDTINGVYANQLPEPIEINLLRNTLGLADDLFGNKTDVSDQVDPFYAAPGGEWPSSGFQFTPEMAMAIGVLEVRNFGLQFFDEADRLGELQALIDTQGTTAGTEMWRDLNYLNDPLAPVSVPDPNTPGFGGPLAATSGTDSDAVADAALDPAASAAKNFADHDWSAVSKARRESLADREARLSRMGAWPKLGSYAWLVAADRSATGNPWVGGFPQTGLQTPSIMHFVENSSGEGVQSVGMEFAGAPLILIGHTDTVAYTTTTAQLRVIDTFFEEIVLEDADNVRYNDEGVPTAMNMRTELFPGGLVPDESMVLWRTHERGGNNGTRPVTEFVGDENGQAESGTATTLVDDGETFTGVLNGGYVLIHDGTGAGQIRQIATAVGPTITVGTPWTTPPDDTSIYVASENGDDLVAVAQDSGAWLEESTTVLGFSGFQRASDVLDMRAAVRLMPSTHNFFAADNQAFNSIGTDAGKGNIGYQSSGFSRKRQDASDKMLPLDGTVANPLVVVGGPVTSATASSLTATGAFTGMDLSAPPTNLRYDNPAIQGGEYIVSIMSGTGFKQSRRIASNTNDALTLEADWGVIPDATSTFEVYEVVAMPEAINPSQGYLGNWNNKAATADDGENFGRQHRAIFINERLAADTSVTRDDQRQLNRDVAGLDGKGAFGRYLVPRLRQAVDAVGNGGNGDVDTVLAQLEAYMAGPNFGRRFNDPLTATTTKGESAFLESLINQLSSDIFADEYAGALTPRTGSRGLALVQHAIDSAAGDVPGSYVQEYAGDYFNGSDWNVVVRDSLSALASGGIPADTARSNDNYAHPLSALFAELVFDPTPAGNRGTWEQIVEVGDQVTGEFIFPLGQSGLIEGNVAAVSSIDPNTTSFSPIWRDWRFLPMLSVGADLAAGDADGDGDGVWDAFERWHFGTTDIKSSDDSDGDKAKLLEEFERNTDPNDSDTDDDGVLDGLDSARAQDRLTTGFLKLKAQLQRKFSKPNSDKVKLGGQFGTGAPGFLDPVANDLTFAFTDADGVLFTATFPAGTLVDDKGDGSKYVFKDKDNPVDGIVQVQIKIGKNQEKATKIKAKSAKIDISGTVTNFSARDIETSVSCGDFTAFDSRRWSGSGGKLKPEN